ncbi:hypothetical protein II654_00285 [bacterium]|nr:hypothetical protein [bacterium]
MKLGNIHINNKTTSISLNDFSQKISFEKNTQKFVLLPSPDYFDRYIESNYYSAHNEFLVFFDKLLALNDIKNKIEQYL